ncbi:A/G-specific adenine glycosylase [Helicobacter mastomyrinus]|uniref:Adenine DNA glycosylase n=1 Tax=Helicobacter mastomyrinus TaxID=287948 RepID=A0ABZ3F965_9HELI
MEDSKNISFSPLQEKARHIAPLWRKNILAWYKDNGRFTLPWRNLQGENAPYGVYVSEMMLQQTQVKRVLECYYQPFMESFPTLLALSYATEEQVLKAWEGLGYYTRARNMLKTAHICAQKFSHTLPHTYNELIALPGIGAYSAGAILCFGFKQNVSFVDGNIRRLLCRIFALSNPKMVLLEKLAQILLDIDSSFDYNQALLDIGATLCTPKSPSCLICPLQSLCDGYNAPHLYPLPKQSTLIPLELHLGICVHNHHIALVRSSKGLYHGLYNLPLLTSDSLTQTHKCGECRHHYTKYHIRAYIYHIDFKCFQTLNIFDEITLIPINELNSKPLSSLCKKALKIAGLEY